MHQRTFAQRAVTALMTLLAVAGTTAIAAPGADAAANRRVCVYSKVDAKTDAKGGRSNFQWAMNYKKAGGCPTNNNRASLQSTARATAYTKVTCEEYAMWVRVHYDPCPTMQVDSLYYIEWHENGGTTFSNRGHY
ncbi:hypothetical protein [Amycolatopsis sp. NPDC059657]|uniref:hypothetical protein n=1 Tax=Amycolatopsis sp. NPDC059657 TaxID=3346899 RepID=UPI00367308E4